MPAQPSDNWQALEMVETQLSSRGIEDERVLQAMVTVPREQFVPPENHAMTYADQALSIGHNQTISQPYMVALMCELLQVQPHHTVLEVGAGSGYQAAVLGQLARVVHAVEIVPALVRRSTEVIRRLGYENVHIVQGDGSLGLPDLAPFDRIIVAAAAPELPPPLIDQLAAGGRIVAPVGDRRGQTVIVGAKIDGDLQTSRDTLCVFVPLVGEHGWRKSIR